MRIYTTDSNAMSFFDGENMDFFKPWIKQGTLKYDKSTGIHKCTQARYMEITHALFDKQLKKED